MKKTVGLALGAGGARGFCHVGVVEVLREHGIPIDVVTGCSMGAVIGGGVATGVSVETMRELAKKINNFKVFDINLIHLHSGIARGNRVMNLYKKYVGEKLIEDCDIKFAAIAAELTSVQLHTFTTGPVWKAVRSSMSIPGAFHPVREGGKVFVDGGILKRMPISEARELGSNIVIAVDALGAPWTGPDLKLNSAWSVFEASYMTMDWRTAQREGEEADILIVPDMGSKSAFSFKNNEAAIQAGRNATLRALPQILKLLEEE